MAIEKNCEYCSLPFFTQPSRIAKGNGRFCSLKCSGEAQKKRVQKICVTCSKPFTVTPSYSAKGYGKFCEASCYFKSEEVKIGARSNIGKKFPNREGKANHKWKGDDVGYFALHDWVKGKLGKADHCENCGLDQIPKGMTRYFQWANISHEYKRDLADWMQLCCKCHWHFDRKNP